MTRKCFPWLLACICTVMLVACGPDRFEKLAHTWAIAPDDVTLELRPDSVFVLTEHNEPIKGRWKLSGDHQYIFIKTIGKTEKRLLVKELTDKKLILSDNGLDQEYTRTE